MNKCNGMHKCLHNHFVGNILRCVSNENIDMRQYRNQILFEYFGIKICFSKGFSEKSISVMPSGFLFVYGISIILFVTTVIFLF